MASTLIGLQLVSAASLDGLRIGGSADHRICFALQDFPVSRPSPRPSPRRYILTRMRSSTGNRLWRPYATGIAEFADRESAAYLASTPRAEANRKAAVVLITSALSLTILNFGASAQPFWFVTMLDGLGLDGWARRAREAFELSDHAQRNGLVFWGIGQIVCYTAPPVIAIKLVLREKVGAYGLRVRGIGSHAPVYGVLLAVSVPFAAAASYTPAFQDKYPFYDLAAGEGLWPNMALWWVVYGLQFLALEFFFRGFMIHGLSGRLGYMAVFVMVVPYNMLHYGKPMAEALAAIVGGIVLGSLSLRSRSIWWGAAVHVGVAGVMDVAALVHKGFLP